VAILRRGEEPVSHVDGDALFALSLKPIEQQREVKFLALRAPAHRIALERPCLIVEDLARLPEQASDQCRLAVVDASAGEESQRGEVQKYPSCFLRSIEAVWSWSMRRP
jgi:hypothetical protein